MLFQTTQAHEELRSKIRAFAEEEIKPIAFMLDQNNAFPHDMVKELAESTVRLAQAERDLAAKTSCSSTPAECLACSQ